MADEKVDFERTPARLFAINLWLNTNDFVRKHWMSLLATSMLLLTPFTIKHIHKSGILHRKRLMTNADLLVLCRDYKAPGIIRFFAPSDMLCLRVKVVSVSSESIRVIHEPHSFRQSSKSDGNEIVP